MRKLDESKTSNIYNSDLKIYYVEIHTSLFENIFTSLNCLFYCFFLENLEITSVFYSPGLNYGMITNL